VLIKVSAYVLTVKDWVQVLVVIVLVVGTSKAVEIKWIFKLED